MNDLKRSIARLKVCEDEDFRFWLVEAIELLASEVEKLTTEREEGK